MSLRTRFLLYLTVIHAVFAVLAWLYFADERGWLFAVEIFFVASFLVGLALTRALFEPIRLIRSGVDLIRAHDFGTRFRPVAQPELEPLISVYNRMADHLREERIRKQEQDRFLEQIITGSPSGIITLDLDGLVTMCNPAAAALLDLPADELRGRRLDEAGPPFAELLTKVEVGDSQLLPLAGRRSVRCRCLQFMDRGFARRFLLLDELTEELHRSEKAAYEKLIRMMSHEVNNTAGAVTSLLDSCLNYADQLTDDDRADFAGAVSIAISRTERLNEFMQDFANVIRLPDPMRRDCDLAEVLQPIAALLHGESGRREIEWRWQLADDLPPAKIDVVQMEQALLNICRNALEAIGTGGTITVTATQAAPADIILCIADDGCGIDDEVRSQLFTPFFTSKKNGQGIGLTLVQEILLGHGFQFSLENGAEGGSVFTIRLRSEAGEPDQRR